MRRHSIIARLGPADRQAVALRDAASNRTEVRFIDGERRLGFGLGQLTDRLAARGIFPSENAIDLAIVAATVTAADTRISRSKEAQDTWTREITLYLPVAEPDLWTAHAGLIERILDFLTGDRWQLVFRARHPTYKRIVGARQTLVGAPFTSVCLFSGGLDSFIAAIDLLAAKANPLFVSHYWEISTSSQTLCAQRIGAVYGNLDPRHVRARIGFPDKLVKGSEAEKTTRGRSFLFLAMAAVAASGLTSPKIYVPENGLISLNVPLDPLRLGAWSTRTTHPFYLARWQDLIAALGIPATIENPYRFQTKGEMISGCANKGLLQQYVGETISCSSIAKARWKKLKPGHCGHCTPCLIRRAAITGALGKDPTTYSLPILTAKPLNAKSAESENIRSFQLMARRLASQHHVEEILVHKPGPLSDYPSKDVAGYAGVFRRGVEEVNAIVKNVIVRP
jgi:7-cyano-7-deazaguanine synthase in queuosine biosynthesis